MQNKNSRQLRIAIVWEQIEWGGVDSYLSYLLNSWPNSEDQIVIFHNKENKGAARLKGLLKSGPRVCFEEIPISIKFYDGNSKFSKLLRLVTYIATPLLFVRACRSYRNLFKGSDYDVVFVQNGGYPGSYGALASIIGAAQAGIVVRSLTVHHAATKPDLLHGWFRLLIEKKLGNVLSSLITVSNATKQTMIQNTRIFDDQNCYVTVIENGIPIPTPTPTPKQPGKRQTVGYGKIKIGLLGRLEAYKGHDDFLCALSLLPRAILSRVSVEFYGGYEQKDFDRLSHLVEVFELDDVVSILGFVERDTSEIIADLDLVAMVTKTFEGFGLTVVEALHQKVPVLATPVGIIPDIFPEGGKLIVDAGNIHGMASAIEGFVNAPNRGEYMNECVQSRLWKYDSNYMAARYRQHLMFEYLKTGRSLKEKEKLHSGLLEAGLPIS